MSSIGELVERLVDAGLSVAEASTIIAEAVAAGAASVSRKSAGALRTQKWRENKRHKASQSVTERHADEASQNVTKRHKASQCDAGDILPIDTKNKKKIGEVKPAASWHRIDPNWQPTPEDRAVAAAEGFSNPEIDREILQFRDYWKAASRSNAVKLDWSATWGIGSGELRQTSGKSGRRQLFRMSLPRISIWESIVQFKAKTGVWSKWAGPEPGAVGCRAPAKSFKVWACIMTDLERLEMLSKSNHMQKQHEDWGLSERMECGVGIYRGRDREAEGQTGCLPSRFYAAGALF